MWALIGLVPLIVVLVLFIWKASSIEGALNAAESWRTWLFWVSGTLWFLIGMTLSIMLCVYISSFKGVAGGKQAVPLHPAWIVLIGCTLSVLPIFVYFALADGIERLGLFTDDTAGLRAEFQTYGAMLSVLPIFLVIAAVEFFGTRDECEKSEDKSKRKSRLLSAHNGLAAAMFIVGVAVWMPPVGSWLAGHPPAWLAEMLPPTAIEQLDQNGVVRPAAEGVVPEYARRLILQIFVTIGLVLMLVATTTVAAWLSSKVNDDSKAAKEKKIKDPNPADFSVGPPSPLAIRQGTFREQPRGLFILTREEAKAKRLEVEAAAKLAAEKRAAEASDSTSATATADDVSASESGDERHAVDGDVGGADGVADESADASAELEEPDVPVGLQKVVVALGLAGEEDESGAMSESPVKQYVPLDPRVEIFAGYLGQSFGGVARPSHDQLSAVDQFDIRWASSLEGSTVGTGSFEDSAKLSSADLIIEGEAGCGRTTVLLAMAYQAVALRGQSVLIIVPGGTAAEAVCERVRELFLLSAIGPFASVGRLQANVIDSLATAVSNKTSTADPSKQMEILSESIAEIGIPDVAVMTVEEYETGFFGSDAPSHGLRALLHRYQVVLVDDILELDIASRLHLPFILDKHRLILGIDGYRCQTVVASGPLTVATRKLLERRLFTAVGSIPFVKLRPWDDVETWLLELPPSSDLNLDLLKCSIALLSENLGVAVFRPNLSSSALLAETRRLSAAGRGPRVVTRLSSLAGVASLGEVAEVGAIGSQRTPIPDPTVCKLGEGADAMLIAYDDARNARMIVRFGPARSSGASPIRVPIMAASKSRGVAWSHVCSVCRLVRPLVPIHRNLWAKFGLSDADDVSCFGERRPGEDFETLRVLEVDPPQGDRNFQTDEQVWPWVVLVPKVSIDADGKSITQEVVAQPVKFGTQHARLHGFDFFPDPNRTTFHIARRRVTEPFMSNWVTDQGLTAGQLDLSYAPHFRRGTIGAEVQHGGATYAAKITKALPPPTATNRTVRGAARNLAATEGAIRVECRPFSLPESDAYMPWLQLAVTLDALTPREAQGKVVEFDPTGMLWPRLAWIDFNEVPVLQSLLTEGESIGVSSRVYASVRTERLFAHDGKLNPISPPISFMYEAAISFLLIAHEGREKAINDSVELLTEDLQRLVHGTWDTSVVPSREIPEISSPEQSPFDPSFAKETNQKSGVLLSERRTSRWHTPGGIELSVDWNVDYELAKRRLERFGVPFEMTSGRPLRDWDSVGGRESWRFYASERGFRFSEVVEAEGTRFNMDLDYARLTMEGAADLRGLAESIVEAALAAGLMTDRQIAEAVTSFVQSAIRYQSPEVPLPSAATDSSVLYRHGMFPAMTTLAQAWGDCDCSSIVAAALLHATGLFRSIGIYVRRGEESHFLIAIQLDHQEGDISVEFEGRTYLPVETTSARGRIGESSSLGDGVPFEPMELYLGEDLHRFSLDEEQSVAERTEQRSLASIGSCGKRVPSQLMSAVVMAALRRHVPSIEEVCRIAAFRLDGDPNWQAAIMLVEPAPTRRSVGDTFREILCDRRVLGEIFTSCERLSREEPDRIFAMAEQRIGPSGLVDKSSEIDGFNKTSLSQLFANLASLSQE